MIHYGVPDEDKAIRSVAKLVGELVGIGLDVEIIARESGSVILTLNVDDNSLILLQALDRAGLLSALSDAPAKIKGGEEPDLDYVDREVRRLAESIVALVSTNEKTRWTAASRITSLAEKKPEWYPALRQILETAATQISPAPNGRNDEFKYDAFLSYSSRDHDRVQRIAIQLRATGLKIWFSPWVITPGDDIALAVDNGLKGSRLLLQFISSAARGSDWVMMERTSALFRDPTDTKRRFIPILLDACELPDTLRRYRYVDYTNETFAAFAQLLSDISQKGSLPPTDDLEGKLHEPQRGYANAKVVLVGESGVGKSGLAHRLIEDRFVPTSSTHGMEVFRLDLPKASDDGLEREALLWDLAGQEDYRLIHQSFLDETALALMLVNPQAADPFAEIGVWLKVLGAAVPRDKGRTMAKLLIVARCDAGAINITRAKIERFVEDNGFADYLVTSALRGDNCSDALNGGQPSALKALIAKHIPWDTLPWTNTPRLLRELKNAVTVLTVDCKVLLVRFSELAQRLELLLPAERFGEAEVRTAVTLLANQGVVMPLKFGDLVLLKPGLLNGYAAAVIRAAREHSDEIGCVPERAVVERTIDLTGVERVDPVDEELLMRALVQTFLDRSLCIAEDTLDGRHLIFPSQYRVDRPIPSHPEIYVSYSFTGEWQTVYTTLVVRLWYSQEFKRHELWRNAADFETSKGARLGLVMTPREDGAATVSVFFETGVPDELKWGFIQYIHRHLDKYARDVTRDRRYICPDCGKPVIDFDMVRERLVAGKNFIFCQSCGERVPLIDHIERQLASDPVAFRVLGMDQKATEALSTQALEQILIGHMMAICGEANQIYRPVTFADVGIDGEIEFRDRDGRASGNRIYVQLKHGDSHLRLRKGDGKIIFDVKEPRHLDYWAKQPCDVWLVIRDGEGVIRWMNVSRYLKDRRDKTSRQIEFNGEKLDANAVWRRWDTFFARRPTSTAPSS